MVIGYNIVMGTAGTAAGLRRRQLDRRLAGVADPLQNLQTPRGGWIRELREALGMTGAQLGARMGGITPATVAGLEKSEAEQTITLARLHAAARAMRCRMVYALVPEDGSLENIVRQQAEAVALQAMNRVRQTMALEAQTPDDPAVLQEAARDMAEDLVRNLRRELWTSLSTDPEPVMPSVRAARARAARRKVNP